MRLDSSRSLFIRLLLLAVVVLVPPMVLIAFTVLDDFERGMAPEMDRKAVTVARDLTSQVERAVGYGIPLDELVGVEDFFAPILDANGELTYLAITDAAGRVLFLKGADKETLEPHFSSTDVEEVDGEQKSTIGAYADVALPVVFGDQRVGQVHVGMDVGYVHRRIVEILIDVSVVMAVSLLLALEILIFVVVVNVSGPLKAVRNVMDRVAKGDFTHLPAVTSGDEVGRFLRSMNGALRLIDDRYRRFVAYADEVKSSHFDRDVIERVADIEARVKYLFRFAPEGGPQAVHVRQAFDIRLALFLFVFAEELSRPFLPLYIGSLRTASAWLSPEMSMAVPIAVFMAFVAIGSPLAAATARRLGSRQVFLIGLVPAVIGFFGAGMAGGVADMVLWRALTGFGYALITMACQSYMSRAVRDERRTQGLGVFVGAVLTASVCGMALGGVLVERVGFRPTFFIAGLLAALSGLLAASLNETEERREASIEVTSGGLLSLLRNWRFSVLMVFAGMPAKSALTGVVFFLAPLHLWKLGYGFGDIARTLMIYAVTVVALSPVTAHFADRIGWRAGLVALGGLIGGVGLLSPLVMGPGAPAVMVALLCLGVGQGLAASPQLSLIPDVCWIECRALGRTNVLGQVRLLERVGSTAGPLVAAAVIPFSSYDGAMVIMGYGVLAMAVVFGLVSPAFGSGPHIQTEEMV